MGNRIALLIAAAIYIAILLVLVRPNSRGGRLVLSISDVFSDLVRGVTGQTFDQSSQTWSPAK